MVGIVLRHTSVQSYKVLLEDFRLPSLSKLVIDAIIYAQALKKDGKISEDIFLLFYEMYLQKYEEYFGSEQIGSYENGELCKGIAYSLVL